MLRISGLLLRLLLVFRHLSLWNFRRSRLFGLLVVCFFAFVIEVGRNRIRVLSYGWWIGPAVHQGTRFSAHLLLFAQLV